MNVLEAVAALAVPVVAVDEETVDDDPLGTATALMAPTMFEVPGMKYNPEVYPAFR